VDGALLRATKRAMEEKLLLEVTAKKTEARKLTAMMMMQKSEMMSSMTPSMTHPTNWASWLSSQD
jgi:hypothetical protein